MDNSGEVPTAPLPREMIDMEVIIVVCKVWRFQVKFICIKICN